MKDFQSIGSRAVVRGMGIFCPLASNCEALEAALLDERDSIEPVTAFDTTGFLTGKASSFDKDALADKEGASWMDRSTLFTIAAYQEALAQSGVKLDKIDPARVAVCLGSSHAGLLRTEDVARNVIDSTVSTMDRRVVCATLVSNCTSVIQRMSGAKGRVMTVSSACASSNSAIGIGADMILRGEADIVIAGGADTVSLSVMAGFNALRALASDKTAPFAQDIGLSLGEGAGIVILTRADLDASICAAPILAQVAGYGLSGDAHHATSPDQDGQGAAQAIEAALHDAGMTAGQVAYINAHGTGTEANDGAESRAMARLFGTSVPASSTKSYYGHTLGASGVIETISSILLGLKGQVPASLRMTERRAGCEPLAYATAAHQIASDSTILVNNFGFGGNNSSLLLSLGDGPLASDTGVQDDVVITGLGVCSAAGAGLQAFEAALDAGISLASPDPESGVAIASCPPLRFADAGLRPFARTAASTKQSMISLKEALGSDANAFANTPRAGLIGGMISGSQKPLEKFMESVFKGPPALANAHYFPMTTLNAVAGANSLAFQIKGYNTTLCSSASALAYAADLTASGRQDRVAAVSGDEMTPTLAKIYHHSGVVAKGTAGGRGRAQALAEFGAAVTLERASVATARGVQISGRLRGWATRHDPVDFSVSRSGEALQRAISAALTQAALQPSDLAGLALLDRGLAPTQAAVARALAKIFGSKAALPSILRPDQQFGFAPSAGAMMAVIAAVVGFRQSSGPVMAAGYDATGEAFAFVIERAAS